MPYERFHEPQWLNKTFGEIKACEALEAKVSKLAGDWETLKSQFEGEPFYAEAERELFATLDLGAALTAARKAAEEAARIAELKAAMEPEPEPEAAPEPAGNWYPGGSPMQEIGDELSAPRPCRTGARARTSCLAGARVEWPRNPLRDAHRLRHDRPDAGHRRFCGSIGVSGVFKRGTLQQVYERTIR